MCFEDSPRVGVSFQPLSRTEGQHLVQADRGKQQGEERLQTRKKVRTNPLLSKSLKETTILCDTGEGFPRQLLVVPKAHRSVTNRDVEFAQNVRDNGTHVLLGESCVLEATATNFNWSFRSLYVCECECVYERERERGGRWTGRI